MSKSRVVIFGLHDFAQLANYYLSTDSPYEVAAFTVHKKYCDVSQFEGRPVIPFEDVEKYYPPEEFKFFAPMSGSGMNKKRESIYLQAKSKGYSFISYVSSKATKFNNEIGENCFILENNTIQPFVKIGKNVVIWSGCHIGHHSVIKDHILFTSQVVLSGHCTVEPYSWFGVNSTIRDDLCIAEGTLVAMGASLTKDSEPWSAYLGIPAKKSEKTSLEMNP